MPTGNNPGASSESPSPRYAGAGRTGARGARVSQEGRHPANDCSEAVAEYVVGQVPHVGVGIYRREGWHRDDDGVIRRGERPVQFAAPSQRGEGDPGYQRASEAIRADTDFGPLIGGMIGSRGALLRFDEWTVLSHAMATLLTAEGGIAFDELRVRDSVSDLRTFVTASHRDYVAVVPLSEGTSGTGFPIAIAEGIEVDDLSDEEIAVCADAGILRPFPPLHPMLHRKEFVGIRVTVTEPARIILAAEVADWQAADVETGLETPHRFGDRSRFRLQDLAEDLLISLRLARPDFVAADGVVLMERNLLGSSQQWVPRSTRPLHSSQYVFDESTVTALRALWAALRRHAAPPGVPPISMRRFNAAADRVSVDDAVVDHLIAAEALLLHDAGSPTDRGELGFRLALRAAALLATTGANRRSVFKFMKAAYDLRSKIAHGNAAPATVRLAERGEVPIGAFLDELTGRMRELLRCAVDRQDGTPVFGTSAFWDALILGEGQTP